MGLGPCSDEACVFVLREDFDVFFLDCTELLAREGVTTQVTPSLASLLKRHLYLACQKVFHGKVSRYWIISS